MNDEEIQDFGELEQKLIQGFKKGLSNFKSFRKKNLLEMYNMFSKIIEYEKKFIPDLR